jgi:beta-lactam-binding protein with PASTA domain
MKSRTRFVLVIAMVGALLSSIVGVAGAQEAELSYLAAVNGASTGPVTVAAGSEEIASGLAYGAGGMGRTLPAGTYDVAFTGGTVDSAATGVNAATGSAQTVVSGYGADPDTAAVYPIDITPIQAGEAKVTVWNATTATVTVTIDGTATPIDPGTGLDTMIVTADATTTIDIDGVSIDIASPADSYTDVFAVNDGATPAIAASVVDSMTALIESLAPGGDEVAVPDVVGMPEADAVSAITGVGLVAGASEAADETVPAGSVISQDPVAGSTVAVGSTVSIVVSTGPDTPATIPVPDVSGLPEGDAQKTLEDAGFAATSTQQPSADVEIGLVVSTNPSAGTEVAPGTSVEMIVSSGPGDVVVPDFTGMTTDEATAAAEAAGLTITFEEAPENPDPDGVVISQNPVAGTTVEGASEVVAQRSPDLGAPWAIVKLDENRQMTVTGVGMLPGSTVTLAVLDTDLTESVAVQDDGSWAGSFDLSDVDNDTEFLNVKGTAADTSDYEATFKIPAAGDSTDEPTDEVVEETSGFPVWAWIVIGLALVAIVLLIIRMVTGDSDDAPTDDAQGPTPS